MKEVYYLGERMTEEEARAKFDYNEARIRFCEGELYEAESKAFNGIWDALENWRNGLLIVREFVEQAEKLLEPVKEARAESQRRWALFEGYPVED